MQILANHSSCGFPMSYGILKAKLNELYNVSPSLNTISWTLRELNELAHAKIQGVGGKKGLWLTEDVKDIQVEALLSPIVTADYISENCTEQFHKILTRLRKKGPYNSVEKQEPKFKRQRLDNFFDNMETINEARINCRQLGFTYNDLGMNGEYIPRCTANHPDGLIIVSVYKIFCKNAFYYMVAKKESDNFLRNYRIDKMTKLFISSIKAEPLCSILEYTNQKVLSVPKYLRGNYKMFNTNIINCKFELKNYNKDNLNYYINTIWDELGNNYLKWTNENEHIYFTAKLPAKGALLFTQQFANFVRLLEPIELCAEMRKFVKEMWNEYE